MPEDCRHLNYLLYTPFRYGPYPRGSRFRRAGFTPGVFYASELSRTAAAEMTFHRLLFFAESPDTPWPLNPAEYTGFAAEYATGGALDLTRAPFEDRRKAWVHATNYEACRQLADGARAAQIDVLKYESARDPHRAMNVAILACRSFSLPHEVDRQTWRIHLVENGARAICEFPRLVLDFGREAFLADPRIARMTWRRG